VIKEHLLSDGLRWAPPIRPAGQEKCLLNHNPAFSRAPRSHGAGEDLQRRNTEMDLKLKGRTVLVTGSSKGIGFAIAKGFASEKCRLHLVSRSADNLNAARKEILSAYDVLTEIHALDLSKSQSVQTLLHECPNPDILVNNAGAIPGGHLDAVDEARWREGWDLKIFGYINMTRAFYTRMREQGHGVIINVIGLAGEKPDVNYVAGTSGNASLMAFTRAVGSNSLEAGVRILGVNPGAVETERIITLLKTKAETEHGDPSRWREYLKNLPMARAARPEEVADLVVFLASDRASYISGTIVTLDGGHAARGGSFS
jgi:NAD(P)-dependent dehydrogenase (short-subunit alcohol dehydrogenase family)